MNGGTGIPMIVAMALLALGPARAGAGGVDQSKFRTEWEPRLIGGSAPAVQGYVENHSLVRVGDVRLRIDSLDGKSLNPAAHYKDLLGWSRKALRVTLPPSATPAQVEAAELLSAIGAQHFVKSVAPAVGGQAKGV